MFGGRLSPDWLLAAYGRGIFPWPISTGTNYVLAWFSPDPRAVIEFERFHVSRRLRRRLNKGVFRVTCNRDFGGVITGCAGPRRGDAGTWITPELALAYMRLHRLGYAHSVEVWLADNLVGGVYGVSLGGYFSAESMFHRVTDASKVALAHLVGHLAVRGYTLLDVQQWTRHSGSMGATTMPRKAFLARLESAICRPVTFGEELSPLRSPCREGDGGHF